MQYPKASTALAVLAIAAWTTAGVLAPAAIGHHVPVLLDVLSAIVGGCATVGWLQLLTTGRHAETQIVLAPAGGGFVQGDRAVLAGVLSRHVPAAAAGVASVYRGGGGRPTVELGPMPGPTYWRGYSTGVNDALGERDSPDPETTPEAEAGADSVQ
jgi:hypothetical protein